MSSSNSWEILGTVIHARGFKTVPKVFRTTTTDQPTTGLFEYVSLLKQVGSWELRAAAAIRKDKTGLVIASDKYFKILQGTIKMGCKEEIRTFCPFCLTDGFCPHLMVENMPPRKIQNIFTVNVFFSFMISEGWPCGDWGYEKIKSSKEKKSVGLIFSFSVKYFLFKLDPSPLMPYLFIKFCKMWNVFNQISPATYHLSALDSFFGVFFLLGNFYFLCRNVWCQCKTRI